MDKKTEKQTIAELEAQVKSLNTLVNHYATKATQLENQLVLSRAEDTEIAPAEQVN